MFSWVEINVLIIFHPFQSPTKTYSSVIKRKAIKTMQLSSINDRNYTQAHEESEMMTWMGKCQLSTFQIFKQETKQNHIFIFFFFFRILLVSWRGFWKSKNKNKQKKPLTFKNLFFKLANIFISNKKNFPWNIFHKTMALLKHRIIVHFVV